MKVRSSLHRIFSHITKYARNYPQFYEKVEQEDYDLCVATQKGLNAGIYSQGFRKSNAVLEMKSFADGNTQSIQPGRTGFIITRNALSASSHFNQAWHLTDSGFFLRLN